MDPLGEDDYDATLDADLVEWTATGLAAIMQSIAPRKSFKAEAFTWTGTRFARRHVDERFRRRLPPNHTRASRFLAGRYGTKSYPYHRCKCPILPILVPT